MSARLSELVGTAHFMRARDRARKFAHDLGVPIFIYRTRKGFECDISKPTVQDFYRTEPTGEVTHCNSGE